MISLYSIILIIEVCQRNNNVFTELIVQRISNALHKNTHPILIQCILGEHADQTCQVNCVTNESTTFQREQEQRP